MITTVNTITIGIVGLVGAASVAYYFALGYTDIKIDPLITAFVSVAAFLLATLTDEYAINLELFGTKGLFTAILVALMSGMIMHFFQKRDLVIHFPDTVPPLVSKSFMSLVPAFVILTIIWIIRVILGINLNGVFLTIGFCIKYSTGILGFHVYSLNVMECWYSRWSCFGCS